MINLKKRRARQERYNKSPKGRDRAWRYRLSPKGIAAKFRYVNSPKGINTAWEYAQSDARRMQPDRHTTAARERERVKANQKRREQAVDNPNLSQTHQNTALAKLWRDAGY